MEGGQRRSPLQRRQKLQIAAQHSRRTCQTQQVGLVQIGSARLGSALQIPSSLREPHLLKLHCTCPLSGSIGEINQRGSRSAATDFPRQPCSETTSFPGVKVQVEGAELLTNTASGDVTAQLTCGGRPKSSPRVLVPVLRDHVQASDSRWPGSDGNTAFFRRCLSFFVTPNAAL